MVTRGDQGAVHDKHGVLRELAQRQVGAPVSRYQQDWVLQGQAPWPTSTARVRSSRRRAVTGLPKQRGLNPVNGPVQDGCDAVSHQPRIDHFTVAWARPLIQPLVHRPDGAATRGRNAIADERRTDPAACARRTWRPRCALGVPSRRGPSRATAAGPHPAHRERAARRRRNSHGTNTPHPADTGGATRWLQKRSIPPQRTVGGAGVDVVVVREPLLALSRCWFG